MGGSTVYVLSSDMILLLFYLFIHYAHQIILDGDPKTPRMWLSWSRSVYTMFVKDMKRELHVHVTWNILFLLFGSIGPNIYQPLSEKVTLFTCWHQLSTLLYTCTSQNHLQANAIWAQKVVILLENIYYIFKLLHPLRLFHLAGCFLNSVVQPAKIWSCFSQLFFESVTQ